MIDFFRFCVQFYSVFTTPLLNVPNERLLIGRIRPLAPEYWSCECRNKGVHSRPMILKRCKGYNTTGRDANHQSTFIGVTIIVYTKNLRREDPNESLRRPKLLASELPQVLRVISLDNVGIHRRRQLLIIDIHEQQHSS